MSICCAINDIAIYREKGAVREPFFVADNIDFSLAWRELLDGKVLSEIYVDDAQLNLAKQGAEPVPETGRTAQASGTATKISEDLGTQERLEWHDTINDLFPVSITHLEIRDSGVRYKDVTKAPHVDVFIANMHAVAIRLQNRPDRAGDLLPARILLRATRSAMVPCNLKSRRSRSPSSRISTST